MNRDGWLLIASPLAVLVWSLAFLLTPDLHSVRSVRDIFPAASFAGLLAAAWFGGRLFKQSGLAKRYADARRIAPYPAAAGVLAAVCLFPLILCALKKFYWVHIGALALIYVLLSIGLNIVVGFSGLLVLGFSAFYGIGAYVAAILTTLYPGTPHLIWFLIPAAALIAAFFGLLLGAPTLRLRGDYLAIVTMGFGEIIRIVFTNWDGLTQGPLGISGVAPFSLGSWNLSRPLQIGPLTIDGDTQYYFLILGFAALAGLMAHRLNQSRIGRAWVAFREDELAAGCFGIDVTRYKLLAFALAAACAGVAGVFFASLQGFVDPTSFTFMESVLILCMVVLGGMGSLPGSVVAAVLLVVIPEKLQMIQEYRMLIFGLVMILLMHLRPQGLVPSVRRLRTLARPSA